MTLSSFLSPLHLWRENAEGTPEDFKSRRCGAGGLAVGADAVWTARPDVERRRAKGPQVASRPSLAGGYRPDHREKLRDVFDVDGVQIEPAVVDGGVLDGDEAAKALTVRDRKLHCFETFALAVVRDFGQKRASVTRRPKNAADDREQAESLFLLRSLQPREPAGNSDACFRQIKNAVDASHVDRPSAAGSDDPAGSFHVDRNLEVTREIVKRSKRHEADRNTELECKRNLPDQRAVATGDHNGVDSLFRRLVLDDFDAETLEFAADRAAKPLSAPGMRINDQQRSHD